MKFVSAWFLVMLIVLFPSDGLLGEEANWNASSAHQAIRESNTRPSLEYLFELARLGSDLALLDALAAVDQDPEIPAPAKDYILFTFTLGLGDQMPGTVSQGVLSYLSNYQPRTLVTPDDHPRMAIPLFNVRAAVAGIGYQWDRDQAFVKAQELPLHSPDLWISAYLEANRTERRGFVDAMEFIPKERLNEIGWLASEALPDKPELTLVTATAAMQTSDLELLQQSILLGGGADLSQVFKTASQELTAFEYGDLLKSTAMFGSDNKVALVIAHLMPSLLANFEVRELLFNLLSNQSLGAAAAQALGSYTNPEVQIQLAEIASEATGLAARRAELAIEIQKAKSEGRL